MTFGRVSNLGETASIYESKNKDDSDQRKKKSGMSLSSNVKVIDDSQSNHLSNNKTVFGKVKDFALDKTRINLIQIHE